jgi:hypothetical protein
MSSARRVRISPGHTQFEQDLAGEARRALLRCCCV